MSEFNKQLERMKIPPIVFQRDSLLIKAEVFGRMIKLVGGINDE